MRQHIANLQNGDALGQAIFVTVTGLLGVFLVLTVYYFVIKLFVRFIKPKKAEEPKA